MTLLQRIDTVRSSINAVQYSQLLHYTAFHTYNTAMISTPLIHGINDRTVLMAEMVTVELQAQLDCQTGQEKRDHWSFSYASNEYSTRLLHSNYFLVLTYEPTHVPQSLVSHNRQSHTMHERMDVNVDRTLNLGLVHSNKNEVFLFLSVSVCT